MANSSKFRADHVGSLIRPQALLEARRRLDAGMIEADELRIVEDEAIADAVKLQKDAGIDIITDGEFRRLDFRAAFVDAFEGVETSIVQMPWRTNNGDEILPSRQFTITGRLKPRRRQTEGDVAYLRTLTSAPVKITLIAPGFLVERFWKDGVTDQVYASKDELAQELAGFYRSEIEALIGEGANYVQLDNPGYSAFLDPASRRRASEHGEDPDVAFERMLTTDIAAIEGIERPRTVSIGMHVCRGNQSSLWLAEGDYEPIAEQLFSRLPVDRFLLEYDSDRAGGFAPLRFIPEGKMVVLGLVSSKTSDIEDMDELQARIDEAAEIVAIDNMALSPQCGFASVSTGPNKLSLKEEFDKLQLVSDTALATWGIEL